MTGTRTPRHFERPARLATAVAMLGAAACSGGPSDVASPNTTAPSVIEARIVVSRSSTSESFELAQPGELAQELFEDGLTEPAQQQVESAQAMAHFAQVGSNSRSTLAAAGLVEPIPAVGRCEAPPDYANRSFSGVDEVRLLDVGEVTLAALRPPMTEATNTALIDAETGEPAPSAIAAAAAPPPVSLAPYAFPSISGFVSGVVYTSRDRSAEALPSGVPYRVAVAGGSELPGFVLEGTAPSELRDVTLGGEPLGQVERISSSAPLDVTWRVDRPTSGSTLTVNGEPLERSTAERRTADDSPEDLVVVDLANGRDGSVFVRCTFADEIGAGTIPAEWLSGHQGDGRVLLHRRRVLSGTLANPPAAHQRDESMGELGRAPESEYARIRLSFDLETSVSVQIAD